MVELLEFTLRITSDRLTEKADAICMFGQTPDNESSILNRAVQLVSRDMVSNVIYSTGGVSVTGKPWDPNYQSQLISLGVAQDLIFTAQITERLAHTYSEASAFVTYAKSRGWRNIYVTAAPFHQPRAFLSTVSSILKNYPELKAYSVQGTPLPWTQVALHSQFVASARRCDLVRGEWERIEGYHASGHLVSARQILNYLNWRDQ